MDWHTENFESNYLVIYFLVQRRTLSLTFLFRQFYLYSKPQNIQKPRLLVIPKEHLNGQPTVATDLEALLNAVQRLHILARQLPAVQLEVCLNARRGHTLGQDAEALGQAPRQQHLLW